VYHQKGFKEFGECKITNRYVIKILLIQLHFMHVVKKYKLNWKNKKERRWF